MFNITNINLFAPELVLSLTAILLIALSLFRIRRASLSSYLATAGLVAALFFVIHLASFGNVELFSGMIILDKPAIFFKVIFIAAALMLVIMSEKSDELSGGDRPEYYAIVIGATLGMNLLSATENLLMIYLALEFVSLMSYLLVGYVRGGRRSSEAALKYVLYGAAASGVFLYGASIYYGSAGTLDVSSIQGTTAPLAGLFMLAGFLYKIAAVPMHAWCPDAYEGAPTPVTAFLSVAPKAAGFAVLIRVSSSLGAEFNWPAIIAVVSAVTMTLGNLAAIPQTNVKRLLAYSSIAHAGYLLMGIACGTPKGYEAVYFYLVAYLIMNVGAFLVVQMVREASLLKPCHSCESRNPVQSNSLDPRFRGDDGKGRGDDRKGDGDPEHISSYSGLARRGTYGIITAICMTIFLLSLTGVPPFVGFIGKFYIFSAVIESRLYWLAVVGIANSVISLYYYMRIVRAICFEVPAEEAPFKTEGRRLAALLGGLSFATVLFGLMWQWLSHLTAGIVM